MEFRKNLCFSSNPHYTDYLKTFLSTSTGDILEIMVLIIITRYRKDRHCFQDGHFADHFNGTNDSVFSGLNQKATPLLHHDLCTRSSP